MLHVDPSCVGVRRRLGVHNAEIAEIAEIAETRQVVVKSDARIHPGNIREIRETREKKKARYRRI